jgi:hypothetical protein
MANVTANATANATTLTAPEPPPAPNFRVGAFRCRHAVEIKIIQAVFFAVWLPPSF